MVSIETLLYIIRNRKVLLILKKRGLGSGLYNAVGGKVKEGEDIKAAAIRECKEEIGVEPIDPQWMGLLEFYNDEELYGYVYIFVTDKFIGEPRETDEAKPVWFVIDNLPYNKMWEDDRYWLPHVLMGKRIYGRFWFVNNWERIIRKEVYILERVR